MTTPPLLCILFAIVVSGIDSKKPEHVSGDNRGAGSRRDAGSVPGWHLRIDIPESNQS